MDRLTKRSFFVALPIASRQNPASRPQHPKAHEPPTGRQARPRHRIDRRNWFDIAVALAREGVSVIVNGRTAARVDRALALLAKAGVRGKVEGIAADLGAAEGVRATTEKYPEVEILVNNLGIFDPKPFEKIRDEEWMKFFEVNVLSGVRLSRHYLPAMMKLNWGRIIFISRESAVQIPAEMIHYGMTKTAQLAVSRGLAETTAGTGVTVNACSPGQRPPKALLNS